MASTGKSAPKLLSIPQLTGIHVTHPEIGKAFQSILEYINGNLVAIQGTRKQPRTPVNR